LQSTKKVIITDGEAKTHEDGERLNGLSHVAAAVANDNDDTPHHDHMPTNN
jgi:hypothetical protein